MRQFNNNTREQRPEVENKVSFSSVKRGQNKHGSPTLGLYLGVEDCAKLAALVQAACEVENSTGTKIMVQIIEGEKYDSGYAYINPKIPMENSDRSQGNGGQARGGNSQGPRSGGGYNRANKFNQRQGFKAQGQAASKDFFKKKQVDSDEAEEA